MFHRVAAILWSLWAIRTTEEHPVDLGAASRAGDAVHGGHSEPSLDLHARKLRNPHRSFRFHAGIVGEMEG